jgi:hypothetical protein
MKPHDILQAILTAIAIASGIMMLTFVIFFVMTSL